MGWYLKKSFKIGPVRLNLSKSGLGTSIGVKGARVGMNKRGAYVHGGREGLYYREKLGGSTARVDENGEQSDESAGNSGLAIGAVLGATVRNFLRGLFRGR